MQRDGVSVESAYAAALERARRTTEALVLAEAMVRDRDQTVARLEAEVADLRRQVRELEQLQEQPAPRGKVVLADGSEAACWHTEPGSPCDWNVCRQKGGNHGQEQGRQPSAAVGEDVPAHPFSD